MTTYLFIPDDDSEFGPVWEESEARENFSAEELADAVPAEFIVNRDGSRGHYLSAVFLDDAADIVFHDTEELEGSDNAAYAEQWREVAEAYNAHGGYGCPGAEPQTLVDGMVVPGLCKACEYIHEDVERAESVLSDLGYVVRWDDGYVIHKVNE